MEIIIDTLGKTIKIPLIEFIFKQPGRLQHIQISRCFLFNLTDTVEAMTAFLSSVKKTAAIPKPSGPLTFLT